MKYEMTQDELIKAVEHYLNDKVLKEPIKVRQVVGQNTHKLGQSYVLHVDIYEEDPDDSPADDT